MKGYNMNTENLMEIIGSFRDGPTGQGRTIWSLHKEVGLSLYLTEKALREMEVLGLVVKGTAMGTGGRLKRVWRLATHVKDMLPPRDNEEQLHALAIWVELGAASQNITSWIETYSQYEFDDVDGEQSWKEVLVLEFQDWCEPADYVFNVLPELYTPEVEAWVDWVSATLA